MYLAPIIDFFPSREDALTFDPEGASKAAELTALEDCVTML